MELNYPHHHGTVGENQPSLHGPRRGGLREAAGGVVYSEHGGRGGEPLEEASRGALRGAPAWTEG